MHCTSSVQVTAIAWCQFNVYLLVQANAKYWQMDTGSDT